MSQIPRSNKKIVLNTLVDPSIKAEIEKRAKENFQTTGKHLEWLLTKYANNKIKIEE